MHSARENPETRETLETIFSVSLTSRLFLIDCSFKRFFLLKSLSYRWIVLVRNKETPLLMDILYEKWWVKEESQVV